MTCSDAGKIGAARRREIDRAPIIARVKQWLACRRLNKLVAERKASFACQDYARRRASALKATRKASA